MEPDRGADWTSARDITFAQALKPLGYATGQFGKNHLGDRNEFLPTIHGFDEFFGSLYHLNAEDEPERTYWPKDDKEYVDNNSPRGVLRCKASETDDPTVPSTMRPLLLRLIIWDDRSERISRSSFG